MSLLISNLRTTPLHQPNFAKTARTQPPLSFKTIVAGALGLAAIGAQATVDESVFVHVIVLSPSLLSKLSQNKMLETSRKIKEFPSQVNQKKLSLKQLHQNTCRGSLKTMVSWLSGSTLIAHLINLNWFTPPMNVLGFSPFKAGAVNMFASLLAYQWTDNSDTQECFKAWDIIDNQLKNRMTDEVVPKMDAAVSVVGQEDFQIKQSAAHKEMQKYDDLLDKMTKCYAVDSNLEGTKRGLRCNLIENKTNESNLVLALEN